MNPSTTDEWQNGRVPRKSTFLSIFTSSLFFLGIALVSGCSFDSSDFCHGITSVAGFTVQFSQGLDNFSEDQYSQLQQSTTKTRDIVNHVAVAHPMSSEASDLTKKINVFMSSMERVHWDVSVALSDSSAVEAAAVLGNATTLTQANTVESLLIGECGLPSTLDSGIQTADTLPPPSIPSPTQTDPPTNTINENSENAALGATVSSLFHLTLSPAQTSCLGAALQGVVDVSSSNANLAQYQGQFQKAFDNCSIPFEVPTQ